LENSRFFSPTIGNPSFLLWRRGIADKIRAMTEPDPISTLKPKLVAVETHPIQYKAPLFRLLAAQPDLELTVLYAMVPDAKQQGAGFGLAFEWDQPLLDGYHYEVLDNRAREPSVTTFSGCDTPGIGAWLKEHRPDAVLVNGWVVKTCWQTLWACRRLRIPCMVRGESNGLRQRPLWKRSIHRLLLSQYNAYLAIGQANRAFYLAHGCPAERIYDAPYAVDNDFFARAATENTAARTSLRAEFGIPAEAVTFLFAGKMEPKKRPLDVIEALRRVPEEWRARAHVLMVGDGDLLPACRASAQDLPVSFTGFLNQREMPRAYAAADALILPSDAGETWGLVVNEAMASGRPALVSDRVGCAADLVDPGKTGAVFPVARPELLADLLSEYIKEPDRAAREGEEAKRRIASFHFSVTVAGIQHALRDLVPIGAAT
jgi:glycosyltransferase involved in cell wall biosynthesis